MFYLLIYFNGIILKIYFQKIHRVSSYLFFRHFPFFFFFGLSKPSTCQHKVISCMYSRQGGFCFLGFLFVCVFFFSFLFVCCLVFLVSAVLPIEGSGSRLVLLLSPFRKQKHVTQNFKAEIVAVYFFFLMIAFINQKS